MRHCNTRGFFRLLCIAAATACSAETGGETEGGETSSAEEESSSSSASTSAGEEASSSGESGTGEGGDCSDACDDAAPSGPDGQALVIEWVDLAGNEIGVRNVSDATVDLAMWQLCASTFRYAPLNVSEIPAGEIATVDTSMLDFDPDVDSISIYSSSAFDVADDMVAYLQWGEGGQTREPVAVEAGLWSADDFVDVCTGHSRIVAVGDTTTSAGYRSQASTCVPG